MLPRPHGFGYINRSIVHNMNCNTFFTSSLAYHLNLWNDVAPLDAGPGERRQRGRQDDGHGTGEAAQVTAGDVIDLVSHHDGVHDKEAPPRQQQGVLLSDERSTLKPQGYGHTPVTHQVKAEEKRTCTVKTWSSY